MIINTKHLSGGTSIGYTVTFTADGSTYATQSCLVGGTIVEPTMPVITGKTFTGWYIGATEVTFPYTPSANVTMDAGLVSGNSCTITGLGNSATGTVVFTKSSGWSDTYEEVTVDGNVFIKFPTMYRKVNTTSNGQITSVTIATAKMDSSYSVYPCFLAEDGTTVLPYVLMGKYCSTSSSTANSVSGSAASMTIGAGRTLCSAKGAGYLQMDWQIFKLWQDLLICAMGTIDTNSGSGITTDALGVYWSSNYPWIDGVSYQGTSNQWAFSYKPSAYTDSATSSTTDYNLASYTFSGTSGYEIMALGYDSSNEFFNYPKTTVSNSSYNTYYCDAVYVGTSATHPVYSVVGFAYAGFGAFCCDANHSWSVTYPVRLCYRPL